MLRPQIRTDISFVVTVDYNLTTKEMVALGHYDYAVDFFEKGCFSRRKTSGVEQVKIELMALGREMPLKTILQNIDRLGYRPAVLEEMLAVGAQYPNAQLKTYMVAAGSLGHIGGSGGKRFPSIYNPHNPHTLMLLSMAKQAVINPEALDESMRDKSERFAHVDWWRKKWPGYYNFLVVAK